MRLRALLPLLAIPAAVGAAVWSVQRFMGEPASPAGVPEIPAFKFAIAREDLLQAKAEDEGNVEPIDLRVLTPAAYAFSDDAAAAFAGSDRIPIKDRFHLLSVLMGTHGSSALVDKRVVRVGDFLGGYKVVAITRDGLNLRGPRGRERLTFLSLDELAQREMMIGETTRSEEVRDKTADTGKGTSKPGEASIPADVRAQMEQDYQRLLKNLKP